MSIEATEDMVRALHAPFWDENLKRGTKSAFQQVEVSLSRTVILPYGEIVEIFKSDLNRPATESKPARVVRGTATINVAGVHASCAKADSKPRAEFVPDPVDGSNLQSANPSHALMLAKDAKGNPKKLPDAVAQSILRSATIKIVES
jgi:hypothetical protein